MPKKCFSFDRGGLTCQRFGKSRKNGIFCFSTRSNVQRKNLHKITVINYCELVSVCACVCVFHVNRLLLKLIYSLTSLNNQLMYLSQRKEKCLCSTLCTKDTKITIICRGLSTSCLTIIVPELELLVNSFALSINNTALYCFSMFLPLPFNRFGEQGL